MKVRQAPHGRAQSQLRRPSKSLILLVSAFAAASGCIEPSSDPVPGPAASLGTMTFIAKDAVSDCLVSTCFEPTVAFDPQGRAFVAVAGSGTRIGGVGPVTGGDHFFRAEPGKPFEAVRSPELPRPALATLRGDNHLQTSSEGRLFYSAIHASNVKLDGIQIASSGDGGDTWDTNVYVSSGSSLQKALVSPDRQWLAFGTDGEILLSFSNPFMANGSMNSHPQASYGIYQAVSMDGGRTFSELFAAVPHQFGKTGTPRIDDQDRVYLPVLTEDGSTGASALVLWISPRLGEPYMPHPVPLELAPSGIWFPQVAVADEVAYLVWHDGTSIQLVATPDQGETWIGPILIGADAAPMGPWIEAGPRGIDIVWGKAVNDGHEFRMARLMPLPWSGSPIVADGTAIPVLPQDTSSHFAFFAYGADGRAVVVGSDRDKGTVLIAIESD